MRPKSHTTIQQLTDTSIHDWYRFVLSYPDHLVSDLLKEFDVRRGQIVLDPFVGTGTTLVECKRAGIDSIGIDANPFTAFASRVKTNWAIDLSDFEHRTQIFLRYLRDALSTVGEPTSRQQTFEDLLNNEHAGELPLLVGEPLTDLQAVYALIPRGAISEIPLRKVLVAKQAIDALPNDELTDLFRLALASAAVKDMSNLGFGPEVYVKSKKRADADLYQALRAKLNKIKFDLTLVSQIPFVGNATVFSGDARQLTQFVDGRANHVITSPPYPNEKDYTRITRMELVLFDFIRDKRTLRSIKEEMLRSHTRNIFASDNDSQHVADIPQIQALAGEIERRRIARNATSGFERLYHRVTTEYFGGMYRVFAELERVVLPGGRLAIVVGDQMSYFQVPIHTAALLSVVACRKLAFREIETRLWRTRLSTATRKNVEEHILILERL